MSASLNVLFAGEVHVFLRSETGGEVRRVVADRRRAGDGETRDVDVAREQFDADVPAERPAEHREMIDVEMLEQFQRHVGVSRYRVGALRVDRVGRRAVARQIERDEPVALRQSRLELMREDFLARRIAVDQQHDGAGTAAVGDG